MGVDSVQYVIQYSTKWPVSTYPCACACACACIKSKGCVIINTAVFIESIGDITPVIGLKLFHDSVFNRNCRYLKKHSQIYVIN